MQAVIKAIDKHLDSMPPEQQELFKKQQEDIKRRITELLKEGSQQNKQFRYCSSPSIKLKPKDASSIQGQLLLKEKEREKAEKP
jgi:hypothetical protein